MGERIVVGLGNPGPEYEHTRHNVGFLVVERVARRWHLEFAAEQDGLRVARGPVAGTCVRLVEPYRFMNRSGTALLQLPLPWQVTDLVAVYDDIDLPVGRLRIRHDGGAGGHRGVASLIEALDPGFDRIRIGVGRPPADVDPAFYVLQPLTPNELEELQAAVERASDAVECVVANGLQAAMNRFNVRPTPEAEPVAVPITRRATCDDTKH